MGEEALEVAENFCRSTAVHGIGGEEGAVRGFGAAHLRIASLCSYMAYR